MGQDRDTPLAHPMGLRTDRSTGYWRSPPPRLRSRRVLGQGTRRPFRAPPLPPATFAPRLTRGRRSMLTRQSIRMPARPRQPTASRGGDPVFQPVRATCRCPCRARRPSRHSRRRGGPAWGATRTQESRYPRGRTWRLPRSVSSRPFDPARSGARRPTAFGTGHRRDAGPRFRRHRDAALPSDQVDHGQTVQRWAGEGMADPVHDLQHCGTGGRSSPAPRSRSRAGSATERKPGSRTKSSRTPPAAACSGR